MLNQTQTYYDRMRASLGDKERMVEHLHGTKVIDMGDGDGALVRFLLDAGYDAYGIDAAAESVHQSDSDSELAQRIKLGYAHEGETFFEPGSIDTILASSLLHEVYSYGIPGGTKLSDEALEKTFTSWHTLLKPGGQLIIRDGILPDNWAELTSIRFNGDYRYADGVDTVAEYLNMIPFRDSKMEADYRKVNLVQTGAEEFTGTFESVMEFIYTYNWGRENYAREAQELYGLFTLDGYQEYLKTYGFKIVEAHSYTQQGYRDHLGSKLQLWRDGAPIDIPPTNALIVVEKI